MVPANTGRLAGLTGDVSMDAFQAYWTQLDSLGRAACRAGPELCLRIAGRVVRLICSSPRLWNSVSPALSPLVCRPSRLVDLTIRAWDSAHSGVEPPSPFWRPDDVLPQGLIRGCESHALHLAVHTGFAALSLWDPATRHAVWWRRDIAAMPSADVAAPFREILHWWSHTWQAQVAHGAVVGWNGWGLLLAAPDGQGKSTTALVCRDAGYDWLADDDVLLVPPSASVPMNERRSAASPAHVIRFGVGPTAQAHRLYAAATLERGHLQRALSHQAGASVTPPDSADRVVLRVSPCDAPAANRGLPLCAVLIPTLTSDPVTRVESAPFAAALRALAPSTVARLPGEQLQTTQQLAEIVRGLPAYHLRLGINLADAPHVLASLVPNETSAAA
jgi:hypothetical protein